MDVKIKSDMKRGILSIGVIACGIVFCALASITNSSALTYESEVDVMFTWTPIINITVSDDLTIESLPASSSSDSNIIDVSASSNSINGYYLYSTVGDTNNPTTDITYDSSNASASNAKFASIDGNKADFTAFGDNQWGYSYSKDAGSTWVSGDTDNTSAGYNALPLYTSATGVKLIENTGTTGTTALKFKIGAKASSSQDSGLYTNVVNFIGVPKVVPVEYTINFYDSSGEATTMPIPNPQTGTTTDGAVVIDNTTPVRTNYLFKGWCDVQTNDDTCSGNRVLPGSTYALGSSSASVTVNLYAMWKLNTEPSPGPEPTSTCNTPVPGITYMQDINSSNKTTVLASLTTDAPYYLRDSRDGEPYCVSKLQDGNLWLLDNLRLDLTNSTILNGLTTTNTNVDANSLTSLKSGNRSAGNQYASSGFALWNSSDIYNVYNQAKANADYKDTVASVTYGAGSGKIGVYYNYCAASAGSYCYDDDGTATGNAQYDLCPAGWRMPTGGDSGEYKNLYTNGYSSNATNFRNALSTPLSGGRNGGSATNQGSRGYFWSSTYSNGNYMYYLSVYASNVTPSGTNYRYYGSSLRCISDDS